LGRRPLVWYLFSMRAMILAAGLGTRLRPLTEQIPKPLMPVVGTPNIVRTIEHLRGFGVRELVINLHHLPDRIRDSLGDGSGLGVRIEYSFEPQILGTGGGLSQALPLLGDETFLVVNGDALFAPDLAAAIAAHRRRGALATLVVRADPQAEEFGAVWLDADDRLRRLVWAGDPGAGNRALMFTGVHVIEPAIVNHLPTEGCIVRETYVPLLLAGAPLFGVEDSGYFCDLGTPRRYLDANVDLVTGCARLPGFDPPPDGVLVGDGAEIGERCQLRPGTVVGQGARLLPGISIGPAVVLPGAEVRRDTRDEIVLADGSVIRPESP
jgi:NDP-sugar pyrophosphorylase family protein